MSKNLEQLQAYLDKMEQYSHVTTLMYWDMKTGMPKQGFAARSKALSFFSTEQFKLSTSEELFELLEAVSTPEEWAQLDEMWKFCVGKMKDDLVKQRRIPQEVFERFVVAQAESSQAWEEAKNADDFSIFAPHLQKMIDMTKEIASYTDPGKDVYEVLLDDHEKGMDSATIDRLFEELKAELVPLVKQIVAIDNPKNDKFAVPCDPNAQEKVQELLLKYMGFSFDCGGVGESEHPFTLNFSSKDVRVTNHYREDAAVDSMFSAIHEGGHAIFEQNVNPKFDGTVAGSCRYMGVHESQSRFYENILGRNRNFWLPIYDKVQELLPSFKAISLDEFYREINRVENSLIRTMADEVTYCFHIIIRYEIEKAIFRDGVAVEELPALWNAKMQEYLQITPSSDATGILQDMHWSDGSFGYFPSYLLGSIYDGMFLDTVEEELGSVDTLLAENRIMEITSWLNDKIHQYGSTRTSKDVIAAVCGKELSSEPLIRYFKKKYTEIYNL